MKKSAGNACATNAIGQHAQLQWRRSYSTMPPAQSRMWDMVSSAKSSNPPLTKEVFLQERSSTDDRWEDDAYGDQDDWGEDDESDEDN